MSWIDDTSAFVSLSQTDQVQIGEFHLAAKCKHRNGLCDCFSVFCLLFIVHIFTVFSYEHQPLCRELQDPDICRVHPE